MDTKLDTLLKIIPASGVIVLISGMIKMYVYYNEFGIPINEYISISEATTSFIDDLIELLMLYGLSTSGLVVLYYYVKEDIADNASSGLKVINSIFNLAPYIILTSLLIYFILSPFSYLTLNKNYINIMMPLLSIILSFSCFLILRNWHKKTVNSITLVMFFLWGSLFYLIDSAIEKANKVKSFKNAKTVIFSIENETIATSDSIAFIGKTDKYVFWLYKHNGVHIIPLDSLKRIRIISNQLEPRKLDTPKELIE